MTQVIKMPSREPRNEHPVSDCPECGALANVAEIKPGGLIIECSKCKFTVASAIDPMFAVVAWNDLYKRGGE